MLMLWTLWRSLVDGPKPSDTEKTDPNRSDDNRVHDWEIDRLYGYRSWGPYYRG